MAEPVEFNVRSTGIDWDADALWAQDAAMLKRRADGGALQDQWGNPVDLSAEALEAGYFPITGRDIFKPRYAPVQVVCPKSEVRLKLLDGTEQKVPAGDAILRKGPGVVQVLARHAFNCRYKILTDSQAEPVLADVS